MKKRLDIWQSYKLKHKRKIFWGYLKILIFFKLLARHPIYSTTLFEKSNFCPEIQLWQNPNIFMSFSTLFSTIFLVKSKRSTAKKSKTTTPKKSTIFSGNQSWIFGQKMKISNSVSTKLKSINEFFTQLKLSFSKICTLK